MMGNYPNTAPLKSGTVRSDLIDYDFAEVKVANNLFKAIVRDAKYDVAELAIVTYLQAKAAGKPYSCFRPFWLAAASITPSATIPNAVRSSRPTSTASASACGLTR